MAPDLRACSLAHLKKGDAESDSANGGHVLLHEVNHQLGAALEWKHWQIYCLLGHLI